MLRRFGVQFSGFFLEIGAHHPEKLSNTYTLEAAAGWNGVSIEPFPVGDWSVRRSHLVQVAVGLDGGQCQFYAPGHELGGIKDYLCLERVQHEAPASEQKETVVKTASIASILREAQPGGKPVPKVIHYLSIDTEGSELDILTSFPFSTYKVLTMTVEHNLQEPRRTLMRQFLHSHGYAVDVSVEHDDFFVLVGYEQFLQPMD